MSTEVTAIIVNHKTGNRTARLVKQLLETDQRGQLAVIVVDNSPKADAALETLGTGEPRVSIVRQTNRGYGAAVNLAARSAGTPWLAILNPDVEANADAVLKLRDYCAANPRVGVAAPRLLNPDGTLQRSFRRVPSVLALIGNRLPTALRVGPLRLHTTRYLMLDVMPTTPWIVPYVLGAFMVLPSCVFQELGGFDESYFMYFEDVELCVRAAERGYEVHYVPEVTAVHEHARLSTRSVAMFAEHVRSALRFYRSHRELALSVPAGGRRIDRIGRVDKWPGS